MPVYFLAGLLLIGGGLLWYLQHGDAVRDQGRLELTPEAKEYVRNLKLSEVEMKASESYLKQAVTEITGKINNAGDRPLQIVEVYCIFYDAYGQLVLRRRVPIVSARMGGLKPGEMKNFRLPFDDIPESWNRNLPQLVIAGLKF